MLYMIIISEIFWVKIKQKIYVVGHKKSTHAEIWAGSTTRPQNH